MSAEIQKVKVVDSRIVQQRPKFSVDVGPLSLTNVPYTAITATSSQMTFNVIVPSESVFVDRAVDWSATVYASVDVTMTSAGTAGNSILVYGRDCALPAFPLHQMSATMSVTCNDTTNVVNTADVANTLFRLADYKENRRWRTCPNMLDKHYKYPQTPAPQVVTSTFTGCSVAASDSTSGSNVGLLAVLTITARTAGVPLEVGSLVSGSTLVSGQYVARVLSATTFALGLPQATVASFTCTGTTTFAPYPQPPVSNSPLNGFGSETSPDIKPNGSWGDFQWCDSNGAIPAGTLAVPVAVTTTASGTNAYNFVGGQPVFPGSGTTAVGSAPGASDVYRLYFRFKSTERLLMSPFIFADNKEISTGLFGIQNIQCLFNFQNPIAAGRILRCNLNPLGKTGTTTATYTVGNALFLTVGQSPFAVPTLNVQYLTPSLSVPLPAKNIVPFQDYPRYISQQTLGTINPTVFSANVAAKPQGQQLNSQTITLPSIPSLLAIFVRPNNYTTTAGGTTPDPTQGDWVLPITGISINMDNYAGLLSSHSQEQLYRMSVNNGLEMDFDQWRGYANTGEGYDALSVLPNQYWGNTIPLSGGPLLLKPGRDIVLQEGQSSGLIGNFSLQMTVSVQNQTGIDQTACQLFVIAINDGMLETIKGSSRILKGLLTEQDILSAPMGPTSNSMGGDEYKRMLGAGAIADGSETMDVKGMGRPKHGSRSKRHSSRSKMSHYM